MPFAHSRSESSTVVVSREFFHSRGALVRELSLLATLPSLPVPPVERQALDRNADNRVDFFCR